MKTRKLFALLWDNKWYEVIKICGNREYMNFATVYLKGHYMTYMINIKKLKFRKVKVI